MLKEAQAGQVAEPADDLLRDAPRSEKKHLSFWGDVWLRFRKQRLSIVALAVLGAIILLAVASPVLAPFDPTFQHRRDGTNALGEPLSPGANPKFILGTDGLGRDLFSRVLLGMRTSLGIGLAGAAGSLLLAVIIGGFAGFAGGAVDFAIMRFNDLMMSVPHFFLMLLLITIFKPGVWVVILVLVIFGWNYPSRLFRAQIRQVKSQDFVTAAQALGVPGRRVFVRHLLPHLLPMVIVYLALAVPGAVFAEAGLSFLGLGVPQPHPSLGSMIAEGQQFYRVAPWISFFPGIVVTITVICINLVGTGLRDAMDPARRGR